MSLAWSKNPAGYAPGQSQTLKLSFQSRDTNTVLVNYSFKAVSNGQDSYSYSQRHNKLIIYFTYIKTDGSTATISTSGTYQAKGYRTSKSLSGTVYLYNVANGVTEIQIAIENKRIWVNAPANSWDPRSTGVVSKTNIGTLSISDNVKYTIKFEKDNDVSVVSNLPKIEEKYDGVKITAPSTVKDSNNFYICTGFTTSAKSDQSEANLKTPTVNLGGSITVKENKTYYATWKPQTYNYTFYKDEKFSLKYKEDSDFAGTVNPITHTYNKETKLPSLEVYNKKKDNSKPNFYFTEYYKEGYTFTGWKDSNGKQYNAGAVCNNSYATNFFSTWKAKTFSIKFKLGFNHTILGDTITKSYTYDSPFDFSALMTSMGKKSDTLCRPGYKLIGWSFKDPNKIFNPLSNPSVVFKYDDNKKIVYPTEYNYDRQLYNEDVDKDGLTLYAVWEYYTTCYVYTNNAWHLAIPYVYTNDRWNITMSYVYNSEHWKL